MTALDELARDLASGRRARARARRRKVGALLLVLAGAVAVGLMVGQTFYGPGEVLGVLLGEQVPGASYTVGQLRLPRMILGVVVGASLGLAGVTYQTMLRNTLASPDIIGISSGASAAAVIAILVLRLSGPSVSLFAIIGALATASTIYLVSYRSGVAGTRLILVGIGLSAMLDAVVAYLLVRAASWDLATAMRWLSGSLNSADWETVTSSVVVFVVLAPILVSRQRALANLRLGDDAATALGTNVERTRLVVVLVATALLACATAAAGPVAFVAFLAGPIATGLFRGGAVLVPSAIVGALLVIVADLLGQFAFTNRYPVGVITGVLGAPYLVYLLVRANRSGGYR